MPPQQPCQAGGNWQGAPGPADEQTAGRAGMRQVQVQPVWGLARWFAVLAFLCLFLSYSGEVVGVFGLL